VPAPRDGFVTALKAELVGRAAVMLGAGRERLDATIDPGVGLIVTAGSGTPVRRGDAVFEVRHRSGRGLEDATRLLREAIEIADTPQAPAALILDHLRERVT
jgi:thymidine phosphorylase